jgi:membrane-associated phospholipid phosphatase
MLRNLSLDFSFYLALGTLGYLLYQLFISRRTTAGELRKIALVMSTLALATGVIVNMLLKQYWGRPRPFRIEELGGEQTFVLPGTISDQCVTNCSFVSGEASGAAWLFTFLLFVPKGWRWPVGMAIAVYAGFFSGLRIAFGRHFLSDVVISALITLCVFMVLRVIFSSSWFTHQFEKVARWSNQLAIGWRRK